MKAGLYRDITPITLHVDEDSLTASLYCSTVHGLEEEALVESFLVEVFRCRVCLFTSGHKSRVVTHLLQRHHVAGGDRATPSCPGDEPDRRLQVSPYSLEDQDLEDQDLEDQDLEDQDLEDQDLEDQDLSGRSKPPSDEDSLGLDRISFLLPMYGMLPNISPRSCDIGLGSQSDGGLHVAQTCEVSTLFEEEEVGGDEDGHMFTLKETCPSNHDDETAQSAHLMTLGLCRISAPLKATPPAPKSPAHNPEPHPHEETPRRDTLRRRSTAPVPQSAASHRTDRRTGTDRYLKKRRKEREKERGRERKKRHTATVQSRDRLHKHFLSKHKTSADKQKVVPPCVLEGRHSAGKQIPGGAVLQDDSRGATEGWGRGRNTHVVKNRGGIDGDEDKTIKTTAEENGGRREFCCSLCNRKFISKLTLRRHMGIHQGEKPYECPHCDYNTRLKASLVQHIRIHTGEKPFRCSECSYASIDRSSLRRHSRTHSQEKPYRCTHCTYSSIQKKSLDLHARRHHTGESFPCQQCAYSSPDRQLLLRHVRKNHTSQHAMGHGGKTSSQPSDR